VWRNLDAHLHLAVDDAEGAAAAVAPVLAGKAFGLHVNVEIEAWLLDALARTRLGEPQAAERSVERALELAEPQGRVWMMLTFPGVKELVKAQPLHRTAHAGRCSTISRESSRRPRRRTTLRSR
jgi:LuxR family maltose regulon positive regulatory protein